MRHVVPGAVLALFICAMFGCSGSDSTETADAGGQAPASSAPAGAAPAAPPAGGSGPPAGMMMGGPAAPGTDTPASDPAATDAGVPADGAMPAGGPGPAGSVPPGSYPGGSTPPAGIPGVSAPPGSFPGGSAPPPGMTGGSIPPGSYPGGSVPPGGAAGGSTPPASYPTPPGGIPQGSIPGGAIPGGAIPGASIPGGSIPGGAIPGGSIPGGSIPGGSIPGGIAGADAGAVPDGATAYPGFPGGTPGGAAAAKPTTFDGMAKQAFEQGRERDAIQYLQAWALTSDSGASEVLSGIRWAPGLKRPTMAVRWGVGIELSTPRGFTGDAKPIGSQQQLGGARGRQGGEAGAGPPGISGFGGGEDGTGGGAGGNSSIVKYAGDFGSKFLEQYQSRVSSGKFGNALKDAPLSASGSSDAGFSGGPGGFAGGIPGGGIPGGSIPGGGIPGGGPPGMRGGFSSPGGGAAGGSEGRLASGLISLGTGAEKDLKEKAVKERVDVLAIFEVKVTVNRAGLINNDVKLVLHDPAKNRVIATSATLNNLKIQKEREQSKDESVDREIKKVFEMVDKELVVTELPAALTPELVKTNRVEKQLLAGSIDDPLAVLTEIRFYHRNKLLTDQDAAAAIGKVAGETNAQTLLDGKEEDRKRVIEKWLPQT